jgi:ATP-dependent Clp protease adaptor protein ClpS
LVVFLLRGNKMFTAAPTNVVRSSQAVPKTCPPVAAVSIGRTIRSCQALPWPTAGNCLAQRRQLVRVSAGKGGVLDNPTITTPTPVKGTESSKKKPPIYKVMLHNDNYNRREYVVKILLKTIEGLTVDDAVNVMQEAHETGVAMVVACAQEQAETYVETLRINGLISTMEPGR